MIIFNLDNHLGTCLHLIAKTDNFAICIAVMEDDLIPTVEKLGTDVNDQFKKVLLCKLIELIKDSAPIIVINKFTENIIQALLFVDDKAGVVIPTTTNCLVRILSVFNYFYEYGVVDHKILYLNYEDYVFQTNFTRLVDVLLTNATNDERLMFASILNRPH